MVSDEGKFRSRRDGNRDLSSERRDRKRSPRRGERPRHRSHRSHRSRTPDSTDRRSHGEIRDRHRAHRDRPQPGSRDGASEARSESVKEKGPLPSQADSFALTASGQDPEKPKEKPNLGTSGLLAAAANAVHQADGSTITLKYHEPAEARKASPKDQWKLFVFKGPDIVDTIDLSARSCWLIGREAAVVDLPVEHPSLSKQHAAIQFRYVEKRNEFGDKVGKVKPYLIDLESLNGTTLNDHKVPDSRYLELRDKDMVKFGYSNREYIVMLATRE